MGEAKGREKELSIRVASELQIPIQDLPSTNNNHTTQQLRHVHQTLTRTRARTYYLHLRWYLCVRFALKGKKLKPKQKQKQGKQTKTDDYVLSFRVLISSI